MQREVDSFSEFSFWSEFGYLIRLGTVAESKIKLIETFNKQTYKEICKFHV